MKKRTRALAIAVAATIPLGLGIVPAYALNEVSIVTCAFDVKGQYFNVGYRNPNGTGAYRCFANAGEANISQGGVERFSSGNNAGWFSYSPGDGYEYRHTFNKWESVSKNYRTINELHIN